jgi:HPt (histidine-containing phosphotransfer) domain-containing protein
VRDRDLPTLDTSVLAELCRSVGDDRAFVDDLVETYLADGALQLADIESKLAQGDAAGAVRPAHTLKSSSATVGAMRLAARAAELERAGRSDLLDGSSGDEHVTDLRREWELAAAGLREWVKGGTT